MGITLPTATLSKDFVRIYPGDTALVQDDQEALSAALEKFHELGDMAHLEPFLKSGERPTLFRLRHLRGQANAEFHAICGPTMTAAHEVTDMTIVDIARLSIASVEAWDGVYPEGHKRAGELKPLKFRAHPRYGFPVLTDESFNEVCDVAGGQLVGWLGLEALIARNLSPKS
jgi:hypothetical protein